MDINLEKLKLQEETVAWAKGKNNILLEYATGSSKSLCALKICLDKGFGKVLILCDEKDNKKTWKKEISDWNIKLNPDIICYHSLHKMQSGYDCIILDECDVITELRLEQIKELNSPNHIFLSAKVPIEKKQLLNQLGDFFFRKISLDDAINRGLLPAPRIKLIPIQLNESIPYLYYYKGKKKSKVIDCTYNNYLKYVGKENYLKIQCTELQYSTLMNQDIDYYVQRVQNGEYNLRTHLQRLGGKRKEFLSGIKYKWIRNNLHLYKDKRYICFLNSVEECDKISIEESLHYKSADDNLIEKFNSKEINRLFAIRKLDRGKNLVDIDLGIIGVLDKKETTRFIQETGRILRGKDPLIVLPYVKGSYEEKILNKIYEEIDRKYFI